MIDASKVLRSLGAPGFEEETSGCWLSTGVLMGKVQDPRLEALAPSLGKCSRLPVLGGLEKITGQTKVCIRLPDYGSTLRAHG